jgi:hypothetical protein
MLEPATHGHSGRGVSRGAMPARAAPSSADDAEVITASDRLLLTLGANTAAVTLLAMTAVAATGRQTLRDTAIAALAGWGFSVAAVSMTSRRHPSRRRVVAAQVLVLLGFAVSGLGAGVVWAAAPTLSGHLAAVALLLGAAALALNYLVWMPHPQSRNSLQ